MANNFLRFKMLMLSRASSQDIFTEAESIFATSKFKATAELANLIKSGFKIDAEALSDFSASLAELLKIGFQIDGNVAFTNEGHLANSTNRNRRSVKIGGNVGIDFRGSLAKKIFYPVYNEHFNIGLNLSPHVTNELIPLAMKTSVNNLFVKSTSKTATPLRTRAKANGSNLMTAEPSSASVLKIKAKADGSLEITLEPKEKDAVNAKIDSNIATNFDSKVVLFVKTKLTDFNTQTLNSLDGVSLSELKYNEII